MATSRMLSSRPRAGIVEKNLDNRIAADVPHRRRHVQDGVLAQQRDQTVDVAPPPAQHEACGIRRRRKRQRLGVSTTPAERLKATHPDHVGALDYHFDQSTDGRILKLLNVLDEHTRQALAILVDPRIDADATVAVLDRLVVERGTAPRFIRLRHSS
jgi:hypothetical protein